MLWGYLPLECRNPEDKFSSGKDYLLTLTLNARAASLLNYADVTAVNTGLSQRLLDNLLRRKQRAWNLEHAFRFKPGRFKPGRDRLAVLLDKETIEQQA